MVLGSGIRKKPIPDPGSRGQEAPDPGSRIRIRNTVTKRFLMDFRRVSCRSNVHLSPVGGGGGGGQKGGQKWRSWKSSRAGGSAVDPDP